MDCSIFNSNLPPKRKTIIKGVIIVKNIETEAKALLPKLTEIRRSIHQNPETGFNTSHTLGIIEKELLNLGYASERCGRGGIVAEIGSGEPVFLLRADIDALPIKEESGLDFASKNGNMHACGHDMHTAMLLGAAKLLKNHENELRGTVKLMFQSAEELLLGANDMIQGGVLEGVDEAFMIHVMTGIPLDAGTVIVSDPGVSAPSADMFEITVRGRGTHGSMPEKGIDPIIATCHIVSAISEIKSREIAIGERAVLTFGSINAGEGANVIPDKAVLKGSLRAFDKHTHDKLKTRLSEVSVAIGTAFNADVTVRFTGGCPALENDAELADEIYKCLKSNLNEGKVYTASEFTKSGNSSSGSEDFAYISAKVPSLMVAVAAGDSRQGHTHPLHHPEVTFDESALAVGAAVYALAAFNRLK